MKGLMTALLAGVVAAVAFSVAATFLVTIVI